MLRGSRLTSGTPIKISSCDLSHGGKSYAGHRRRVNDDYNQNQTMRVPQRFVLGSVLWSIFAMMF